MVTYEKKVEDTKTQGKNPYREGGEARSQREQEGTRNQENWEEFFSRGFRGSRALLTP